MFRRRPRPSTIIATAALVLATSGTAIAAAPGDPFKLGQDNQIVKETTSLSGTDQNSAGVLQLKKTAGTGAVLKVTNEGQGVARGIDIKVAPNKSPITVNPDAGKASGLDVDKLDGFTSSDFLQPRIYSDGAVIQGTKGGGEIFSLNAINANLRCDTGDIALNAGGVALDKDDDLNGITSFKSSYQIQFQDNGAPGQFRANIICLDAAQPFRG
jgi:hypothetical protein